MVMHAGRSLQTLVYGVALRDRVFVTIVKTMHMAVRTVGSR